MHGWTGDTLKDDGLLVNEILGMTEGFLLVNGRSKRIGTRKDNKPFKTLKVLNF